METHGFAHQVNPIAAIGCRAHRLRQGGQIRQRLRRELRHGLAVGVLPGLHGTAQGAHFSAGAESAAKKLVVESTIHIGKMVVQATHSNKNQWESQLYEKYGGFINYRGWLRNPNHQLIDGKHPTIYRVKKPSFLRRRISQASTVSVV